ncbi:hypothetical protein HY500_00765 [Candidatus Woesearchaeota archaeon]|nr:hypothetical protein [Candidatus Woesearchaeota archaeon]
MREEDIIRKYQKKLKSNISMEDAENYNPDTFSREYRVFRRDSLSSGKNLYENACNNLEDVLSIRVKDKDYDSLKKSIDTIHLDITPEGAASFASFISLSTIFIGLILSSLIWIITEEFSFTILIVFLIFFLIGALLLKPLTGIPNYLANGWRLKAGNQMVLCILYVVMYMRHTSNLEHALKFAADHVGNPLSLDLRKIFWDVETGKYSTIKESLDFYLVQWRDYNLEFVEAFHLIEGSLLEESDDRRISLLEKSLEVILDGMYERMLHYAHELQNPITILNMLGVVLPVLGLVILPLLGSLVQGSGAIKALILFLLYNMFLPVFLYLYGTSILSKRPTGYSEADILKKNPRLRKYSYIVFNFGGKEILFHPFWIGFFVFLVIGFIGLIPLFMMLSGNDFSLLGVDVVNMTSAEGKSCSFGSNCFGPFGPGAVLFGLFLPLGLALGIGVYYRLRSKNLITLRNNIRNLEKEFSGGLFQLGNRVGDGVPVEVAFNDVAQNMEGTPTGDFFRAVSYNIQRLGMSVKSALFGSNGAIMMFPSSLIETSMKVLLESSRKGTTIVAKSLISISTYVNRIHQVNERLKDLLNDTLSSMKSQISFLSPIISGIVVGISTMIVTIIVQLIVLLSGSNTEGTDVAVPGNLDAIAGIFNISNIIPSYYMQLIIGLYLVEIVIILSLLSTRIEYGLDPLQEQYTMSSNLFSSSILYFILAVIVTVVFTLLVSSIVPVSSTSF